MTDDPNEHSPDGGDDYRCPRCGSDELAANTLERKTVCIDASGQITGEASGSDTDFESFRCIACRRHRGMEDEVVLAVRNIAAAADLARSRTGEHELACYHRVLDRLNDIAAEQTNPLR